MADGLNLGKEDDSPRIDSKVSQKRNVKNLAVKLLKGGYLWICYSWRAIYEKGGSVDSFGP